MTTRFPLHALLAALAATALAIVLFSSTGHDDSHITFWSAWSLAELGEIVNHSGQRVEQSSSLLHTLVLAALYRVTGAPLAWIAYVASIMCAVLSIVRLPALARACGWELWKGATLVIATSPGFAYWQLGMLEGSLFTLASIEFLIRIARANDRERAFGALDWIGLLVWTGALAAVRPEAGIVALCVTGAMLVLAFVGKRDRSTTLRAFGAVALAGAWLALLIAFRQSYFGESFPQPVAAKLGGGGSLDFEKFGIGLGYLVERFSTLGGGLLLVGLIGGVVCGAHDLRTGTRRALPPLLFALAYACFIIAVGGDWMFGWRFVSHVEVLFVFLLFYALQSSGLGAILIGHTRRVALGALALVHVAAMVGMAGGVSTGMPIWTAWQGDPAVIAFSDGTSTWPERANQVHERDVVFVDDLKATIRRLLTVQDRVTLLSKQGGYVMFEVAREFYGSIEFYDRLGLVSTHFADIAREYDIPSGQMGYAWKVDDILRLGETRDDAILHPDVIFDVEQSASKALRAGGYTIVFQQFGATTNEYLTPKTVQYERTAKAGVARLSRDDDEGDDEGDDVRDELTREAPDGNRFWSSETSMIQMVAVRNDLAEKAGLVGVAQSNAVLDVPQVATRHSVVWPEARKPFLRYLFGERPDSIPPPPTSLPLAVRYRGSAVATTDGAQRVLLDPQGTANARIAIAVVAVGQRVLTPDADWVREDAAVRLLGRAAVQEGDTLQLFGLTVGEDTVHVSSRTRPVR